MRRLSGILRTGQSLTCGFGAPLNLVETLGGFFVDNVWRSAAGGVLAPIVCDFRVTIL
jgi:hypothetical protein